MTATRATAAVFWSYTLSNFKALYGRGGAGFTKDFLQVKEQVRNLINEVTGFQGEPITIRIQWPGGHLDSRWDNKDGADDGDDRGQLKVRLGTGAAKVTVEPWRVGDPAGGVTAIEGDKNAPDDQAAAAVHDQILAANTRPWIVGVFLAGEPRVMHARSYLTNPPVGLEHFGVATLPDPLRSAIMQANARELARVGQKMLESGFTRLELPVRAGKIVRQVEAALAIEPNVLIVGPPGCGKTVALEDMESRYRHSISFDPGKTIDAWSTAERGKCLHMVFHPAYSYESFVAGLAPQSGHGINVAPHSGPLVNMAHWCADGDRDGLLIIDEISRGPAAAIFGDTLGLLDGSKRSSTGDSGRPISRPHADREMIVPPEYEQRDGNRSVPGTFALPRSLKIVGAYNSTDRSVTPLDMAFVRRFRTIRVGPDPEVLATHLDIRKDMTEPALVYGEPDVALYGPGDIRRLAVEMMIHLNERILSALGPDFELGHALFWSIRGENAVELAASLSAAFQDEVYPSLEKAFIGKSALLAATLNAVEPEDDQSGCIGYWTVPPGKLQSLVDPRFIIRDLKSLDCLRQLRLLRSIIV